MRVALVYPPSCDPTAPYLALPALTGFLRSHSIEVLPIDANVEAWDELLEPLALEAIRDRIENRLSALNKKNSLCHEEQLEYLSLARARGDARCAPKGIRQAKNILRNISSFFDPKAYSSAVATIDAALRAISAAYHPLHLDFTAYRTPFGLMSVDEIKLASGPEKDPFDHYVQHSLLPKLQKEKPDIIGLSVCFPGQLQPAFSFALAIKRAMPDVHLTCGGPGITQMMIRLSGERLAKALGPFDSACVFEGEDTLLALAKAVAAKESLRAIPNLVLRDKLQGARFLAGHGMQDLKQLPPPDFEGLPFERYFSPIVVLPYDPTRGCYWGKCTFCHYGLAEVGTAAYRERDNTVVTEHLKDLSQKHKTRHFYFSQDSIAPKTILKLSSAIIDSGLDIRWATDLKPEKYMTKERADTLKKAGAVACALGVESGSERVLELIDKGAPPRVVGDVIENLAKAGVAAEAMCFTDFPTETHEEALQTLDFLFEKKDELAVYIVGEFGLTHGSLVAQQPSKFDIKQTWEVEGDELGLGIFFEPERSWKSAEEKADIDTCLEDLSQGWALRKYPWAGAVSTAHTVLYYEKFGPSVFRDLARKNRHEHVWAERPFEEELRFDLSVLEHAEERDSMIWATLVQEERKVGRHEYAQHTAKMPEVKPKPVRMVFAPGREPVRAGRRPSHASNHAQSTRRLTDCRHDIQ